MDGSSILPEKSEISHPEIRDLNPEGNLGNNPFNHPDRHPERHERAMGEERRIPIWDDMTSMVSASGEDNREYGIAITRDPEDFDLPLIEYLRGVEYSISNDGGRRRPFRYAVFFHTHPSSHTSEGELTSLLVSNWDLDAMTQDYGGGYLNNASINGVTLHTGASEITDQTELPFIHTENSQRIHRQIESGNLKGLKMGTNEEIVEALKKLLEEGSSFVYSMSDAWMNVRYYFIHIPWEHINRSVSFYDLCFGEGLTKMTQGMERSSEIPMSGNLCQAMVDTAKINRQALDRKFEERKRYIEEMRSRQNRWSKLLRRLKIRQ